MGHSHVQALRVSPALAVILRLCQYGEKACHETLDSWNSQR